MNAMMQKFLNAHDEPLISELAQYETGKRQYYRPIYSIHKWWARRPGALFRSILLAATEPDKPLFAENGQLSRAGNYFDSHTEKPIIILDPFMGGGTTLVEANRLGLNVIGCDLNPVSYWIVRESLKAFDTRKFEDYFADLSERTGQQIRELYATKCPQCLQKADTFYAFWVRYITCPECGEPLYLFKRSLLNEGQSRTKPISAQNLATVFCPQCFALNSWDGTGKCICTTCAAAFDPTQGLI
ncbi:MAG: hypothetical protein OHK0052_00460 [Anaerolineales bacterium]